jgi:hypothetical protein
LKLLARARSQPGKQHFRGQQTGRAQKASPGAVDDRTRINGRGRYDAQDKYDSTKNNSAKQ